MLPPLYLNVASRLVSSLSRILVSLFFGSITLPSSLLFVLPHHPRHSSNVDVHWHFFNPSNLIIGVCWQYLGGFVACSFLCGANLLFDVHSWVAYCSLNGLFIAGIHLILTLVAIQFDY